MRRMHLATTTTTFPGRANMYVEPISRKCWLKDKDHVWRLHTHTHAVSERERRVHTDEQRTLCARAILQNRNTEKTLYNCRANSIWARAVDIARWGFLCEVRSYMATSYIYIPGIVFARRALWVSNHRLNPDGYSSDDIHNTKAARCVFYVLCGRRTSEARLDKYLVSATNRVRPPAMDSRWVLCTPDRWVFARIYILLAVAVFRRNAHNSSATPACGQRIFVASVCVFMRACGGWRLIDIWDRDDQLIKR